MSKKSDSNPGKKTPNIVILGQSNTGKTTLLASICHYINTQDQYLLQYDLNEKEKLSFLNTIWQSSLVNGEFPPEEDQVKNEPVELSFKQFPKREEFKLRFVEVPGKTISFFYQKDEMDEGAHYLKDFLSYMAEADMAIITIQVNNAHSNDLLVNILLQSLQDNNINIPIILVMTKWDELKESDINVKEFVKSKMPASYKWLIGGYFPKTAVFKFSVGEVSERYNNDEYGRYEYTDYKIVGIDPFDSGEIFNWIFDYFYQEGNGKKRNALEQMLKANLSRLSKEPENVDLLKEIKKIYLDMGEEKEARAIANKLDNLAETIESELNMGKHILLQQLELQGLDFFGDFKWDIHPGINVLLGRNGYGKSYLLRLMAALMQKNVDITSEFFANSKTAPFVRLIVEREGTREQVYRNQLVFEDSIGRVPVLAIPDMRGIDRSKTIVGFPEGSKIGDLSQHWSYHFLFQEPVDGLIQEFLYQLSITYLDREKTFDLPIFDLIHKVVGKLSDQEFRFHSIEKMERARFKIEVITEGNNTPIPLQKASQGTLSVLAIFGFIYSYLQSVYPKVEQKDLLNQSAVVLIDEIDAHLHPSWQQKIIGLLREHFPNVQFVVTAHSPLVVAGCKEGEVAVLKKVAERFDVKLFSGDFIGYEAGELYEKVFEIEEKDDSYLHYNALYPFREEIDAEIKKLEKEKEESGETFPEKKEKELLRLYDDLYYSEKANERLEKRREHSRITMENKKLKSKIKKLENRGQAVE